MHRAEARVAAALPASAPVPRLLDSWDEDGWVVLLFEEVDGVPPAQPWRPDELRRVLDAVTVLSEQLTPSPIEVPTVAEQFGDTLRGWRRLHRDRSEGRDDCADLDPWVLARLPELAELEAQWEDAATGSTLAHGDLRADNLLLAEHRVMVVDWPWACTSNGWFDLLGMLPSVQMHGGPPAAEVFDAHPVAAGADPDAVDAVLCAMAGYLVRQGRKPPPPGLAGLRAFQAAQARVALDWLRGRPRWR
jgi:aminoglycoside phosphotransferase (APT) family kinase protein